jgi:hypothetical protein
MLLKRKVSLLSTNGLTRSPMRTVWDGIGTKEEPGKPCIKVFHRENGQRRCIGRWCDVRRGANEDIFLWYNAGNTPVIVKKAGKHSYELKE